MQPESTPPRLSANEANAVGSVARILYGRAKRDAKACHAANLAGCRRAHCMTMRDCWIALGVAK